MTESIVVTGMGSAKPGRREPGKVAIVCSGLGHIRRGNETWAQTVAEGLHTRGECVSLLGGGSLPAAQCPYVRMWNLPREYWLTRRYLSWQRRYLIEQLTSTAFLL